MKHTVPMIVVFSCAWLVGCNGDDGGMCPTLNCITRATQQCYCGNGGVGVQECEPDGTWGSCEGCLSAIDAASDSADTLSTGEISPPIGEMVAVPGGRFMMGYDPDTDTLDCHHGAQPYHEVTVPDFTIDKTEVTVSQYAACVGAQECDEPTWNCSTYWQPDSQPDLPVTCLSWYQAKNYCERVGKHLCNEAEWEKAARGTDGRLFPWGNEKATCYYTVMLGSSSSIPGCGEDGPWPVGSKPEDVSPYGALDMAGNVSEWVADDWIGIGYQGGPRSSFGPSGGIAGVVQPGPGGMG